MADPFPVENLESFQNLFRNLSSVPLGILLVARNVLGKVSMLDVLHGDEYVFFVFIPSIELDKKVLVLYTGFF